MLEREIVPGEIYFSALLDQPGGINRLDFASESWPGPPTDCFCWWRSRLPEKAETKIRWAKDSVLLAYFEKCYQSESWPLLNVLALALVRRRLFSLDYQNAPPNHASARQLNLTLRATGDIYHIPELRWQDLELAAIQSELDQHLFSDQMDDDETEEVSEME